MLNNFDLNDLKMYRGHLVEKLLEFVYLGWATVRGDDEESAFTQLLFDW